MPKRDGVTDPVFDVHTYFFCKSKQEDRASDAMKLWFSRIERGHYQNGN